MSDFNFVQSRCKKAWGGAPLNFIKGFLQIQL